MCDNVNTTQNAQFGSHDNSFVAQQINNYGLTVPEATKMAFQLFREYYPQLQKEALETVQHLLEEHLKAIPSENVVPPKANIVVPTLQNASLTEEPDLLEMYATILGNSMDKLTKEGVHPGFVEIIKQISSDEAKILQRMRFHSTIPIITLRFENEKGSGISVVKNFSDIGERTNCVAPHSIGLYFDNLQRLGLISIENMVSLTEKRLYDSLRCNEYIVTEMKKLEQYSNLDRIDLQEGVVMLSDYGKAFCKVCCKEVNVITVTIK